MEYYRIYNYLTRGKGSSLRNIDRNLALIPDKTRFDSNRFDILAARTTEGENKPVGIYISDDANSADTLVRKAITNLEWIEKHNGSVMMISLHDAAAIYLLTKQYTDTGKIELYSHSYLNNTHRFSKYPEKENQAKHALDAIIKNHRAIEYVLGKLSTKSKAASIAKIIIGTYSRISNP
jgi:hypothetical protein